MIPLRDVIPSLTTPYVTIAIIVLNVLVFLYELTLGPDINDFVIAFGFIGVFLGPTLLAIGFALIQDWSEEKHRPVKAA